MESPTWPATLFYKKKGPITTHDYVNMIDHLENQLGPAYKCELQRDTEGGIDLSTYPGSSQNKSKSVRMTHIDSALLCRPHGSKWPWISTPPSETFNQWKNEPEKTIFNPSGNGYTHLMISFRTYEKGYPSNTTWTTQEMDAVTNSLGSAFVKILVSDA